MTVENPVTRWIARWIMRIEAAGNVLRIVLFGGTFVSTGVSALATYGHAEWAWPFVAVVTVGTVVFAYVYAERGVLNQKNRDSVDIGDNYSGPTMLMDSLIEARQLALLGYVLQNGGVESYEDLAAELEDVTVEEWTALRDGVDTEALDRDRHAPGDGPGDGDGAGTRWRRGPGGAPPTADGASEARADGPSGGSGAADRETTETRNS
ncbi:hypothetical protein [Halobaculum lipolyticum]|uniref:DUF4231 domain-containing protein n=1 Tax=Halobaculum lipolyticum TaxID=3032001 RepID=A0ABD5WIZ2_9EURY|nr:hypothetical protein [Halobaculum sp. DT31]